VGRQEEALARGEQLLELASTREPDEELARLASAMGNAHFFAGDHDRADELLALALDLGESLRVPEAICRAFAGMGMRAMTKNHPEEALAYTKHGLTIALDSEDWERAFNLYFNLSDLQFQRDRYEEALAYLEDDLAIVRRRGSRPGEWSVLAESTYPLYMLGRWEEALARAAEVPEEKLSAALTMSLLASVLEIRVFRGDPTEARRLLSLFGHLAEATDIQDRSGYLAAKAAVLRAEGRLADALTAGVEAAELSRELFNMSTQTVKQGLVEAIEAALGLGETERAAELVGTIEAIPPGLQPPYLTAHANRFRALLGGSDESTAIAFGAAARGFSEIGVVFWQAVTLLQHGEWLVARGRPGEAAPLLAEARETLERLETTPWLERLQLVEAALDRAGARG
jgi:tetratricopeptide (TPR) repeat protein